MPRLPANRIERREKNAGLEGPLVLAAKIENALRISALDAKAARLGLREGMPLADARAMIQPLRVIEADPGADAKLLGGIADWCERYTPLVALDGAAGLILDVTGCVHLFGGERAMLEEVRRSIAHQGFDVQVAIAGTVLAARALARYAPGTIVSPGGESVAVAPLPIAALDLETAATHALRVAGLKTVGQVAARGRAELASRFGRDMLDILDEAMGRGDAPIAMRRALPEFMAERRFAEPIVADDVIFETIRSLAQALAETMEQHARGLRRIEAVFFRADGASRRIAVMTGRPERDPAIVERLFRERLKALSDPLDCGFGFDLIRLEAIESDKIVPEITAFGADATQKEIHLLVDRLAARIGGAHVSSFEPQDTHIPEASVVFRPAQSAVPAKLKWEAEHRDAARPLRLLEHPEPIDVMAEVPDGPPIRFRWRRALHSVAFAAGPERIAMEWWRSQKPQATRDYFRVEDEGGARFWVYRSGLYGRETEQPNWYLHGLFA